MGAKVICDDAGLPQAGAYYSLVNTIPVGKAQSIKADRVMNMGGTFTLRNLIGVVKRTVSHGDDLCIVCHGIRNKLGVIVQTPDNWLDHKELEALLKLDPNYYGLFGMEVKAFAAMIDEIFQIQALKINHLAVRACRIGNDARFLKKLGKLFGASTVSAPTLKTAYLKPRFYDLSASGSDSKFRTAFPSNFDVPLSTRTGKVIVGSSEYSKTQFLAGVGADTDASLKQFYADNFPGRITPTKRQVNDNTAAGFPMHGFCAPGEAGKFYFPNDPRYASSLTYVSGCRSSV